MVIEQAGKATGNVIESTGKGFSEATSGLPWWAKAAIIAGGIGVAGYLGYYAINQLTGPSGRVMHHTWHSLLSSTATISAGIPDMC